MQFRVICPETAVAGSMWEAWGKLLLPLLLPTVVALVTWAMAQLRRRSALRASYLAQLQSLKTLIDGELQFLEDPGQHYTWFPILPYFQGAETPWSAAGLLSAREIAAVVAAHSTYRERLAYIGGYASVRQEVEGVDNALGIDIAPGAQFRDTYRYDLRQIQTEVNSAFKILGTTRSLSERLLSPHAFRAALPSERPAYEAPKNV